MNENRTMSRDRGEATMWVAIATPIVMIACLALVVALWVQTNIVVALVVFGVLCAVAWFVFTTMRKRARGL